MKRTRSELLKAIRSGMSVIVTENGITKHITKESDLPSEAEMAKGNPEALAQVKKDLIAKARQLLAEAESIETEAKKESDASSDEAASKGSNQEDSKKAEEEVKAKKRAELASKKKAEEEAKAKAEAK